MKTTLENESENDIYSLFISALGILRIFKPEFYFHEIVETLQRRTLAS